MGKYDLSNFKKKIAPRDKNEVEKGAASRFSKADETLGVGELKEKPLEKNSFARVVRKTFSIPEIELNLIHKIKDKALNRKVVLSESEVVRLGFLILSELSDDDLEALSEMLEKIPTGRPPKKQIKY